MIAIGYDSAGVDLAQHIKGHLDKKGLLYKDFANSVDGNDYPDFGDAVAQAVLVGDCERGILICGTGIGISIAANRHKGIRCALCHDTFSAKATREHNDANILALGGRVIGVGPALEILDAFLATDASAEERHKRRVGKLG